MNLNEFKPVIKMVDEAQLTDVVVKRIPYNSVRKLNTEEMLNCDIKELVYRHLVSGNHEVTDTLLAMLYNEETSLPRALDIFTDAVKNAVLLIAVFNEFNISSTYEMVDAELDKPVWDLKNALTDDIRISDIAVDEKNPFRLMAKISYVKRVPSTGALAAEPITICADIPLRTIRDNERDVVIAEEGDILYYVTASTVGDYKELSKAYANAFCFDKALGILYTSEINQELKHCADCVKNSTHDKCFGMQNLPASKEARDYLAKNNGLVIDCAVGKEDNPEDPEHPTESIEHEIITFHFTNKDIAPLFGKKFGFANMARIMVETAILIDDELMLAKIKSAEKETVTE